FHMYKNGFPFHPANDALPFFKKMTARYKDLITIHQGDFLKENKPDGDIAILFVDISKTFPLNDHILREFIVGLKAGSIIIQQDFLSYNVPWLYSAMKKLEHKVEFLSNTSVNSVIFGVNPTVTPAGIQPCLAANTSNEEIRAAIVDAKKRFPD